MSMTNIFSSFYAWLVGWATYIAQDCREDKLMFVVWGFIFATVIGLITLLVLLMTGVIQDDGSGGTVVIIPIYQPVPAMPIRTR